MPTALNFLHCSVLNESYLLVEDSAYSVPGKHDAWDRRGVPEVHVEWKNKSINAYLS